MPHPCCCEDCILAEDSFDGEVIGDQWSEISGTWSMDGGLKTGDSSAFILWDEELATDKMGGFAVAEIPDGGTARLVISHDSVSGDSVYFDVHLTSGEGSYIQLHDTLGFFCRRKPLWFSGDTRDGEWSFPVTVKLYVCFDSVGGITGTAEFLDQEVVDNPNGNQGSSLGISADFDIRSEGEFAGLGTGGDSSGEVLFTEFSIQRDGCFGCSPETEFCEQECGWFDNLFERELPEGWEAGGLSAEYSGVASPGSTVILVVRLLESGTISVNVSGTQIGCRGFASAQLAYLCSTLYEIPFGQLRIDQLSDPEKTEIDLSLDDTLCEEWIADKLEEAAQNCDLGSLTCPVGDGFNPREDLSGSFSSEVLDPGVYAIALQAHQGETVEFEGTVGDCLDTDEFPCEPVYKVNDEWEGSWNFDISVSSQHSSEVECYQGLQNLGVCLPGAGLTTADGEDLTTEDGEDLVEE